ncbi:uncharacterized protein SCODWIG_01233 [Saccharomycodes ludwigii]|uniref:Zn(2)-C6 fungal-type domain-containing protein n=1 Tax=Saccharomycodes ludwigii TaxID=36035 RepID=A0A376B4B8_9ASCO|nr:uncharacterized protein SCODWIG_01233 [Saccharomycodes ludwigii]
MVISLTPHRNNTNSNIPSISNIFGTTTNNFINVADSTNNNSTTHTLPAHTQHRNKQNLAYTRTKKGSLLILNLSNHSIPPLLLPPVINCCGATTTNDDNNCDDGSGSIYSNNNNNNTIPHNTVYNIPSNDGNRSRSDTGCSVYSNNSSIFSSNNNDLLTRKRSNTINSSHSSVISNSSNSSSSNSSILSVNGTGTSCDNNSNNAPVSKRQRVGPSCDLCRAKKIKCDAIITTILKDDLILNSFSQSLHCELDKSTIIQFLMSHSTELSNSNNVIDTTTIIQNLINNDNINKKEYKYYKHVDKLISFKACSSCRIKKQNACRFSKGLTRQDINIFNKLKKINYLKRKNWKKCGKSTSTSSDTILYNIDAESSELNHSLDSFTIHDYKNL